MIGQNSEDETGIYSVGHGPDKCHCTLAEKCPYWIEKLGPELSMNRGLNPGGGTPNLIYVGGTAELDALQHKRPGPSKPKGHGPQG